MNIIRLQLRTPGCTVWSPKDIFLKAGRSADFAPLTNGTLSLLRNHVSGRSDNTWIDTLLARELALLYLRNPRRTTSLTEVFNRMSIVDTKTDIQKSILTEAALRSDPNFTGDIALLHPKICMIYVLRLTPCLTPYLKGIAAGYIDSLISKDSCSRSVAEIICECLFLLTIFHKVHIDLSPMRVYLEKLQDELLLGNFLRFVGDKTELGRLLNKSLYQSAIGTPTVASEIALQLEGLYESIQGIYLKQVPRSRTTKLV
jgi:hypothetical protein